jgi:hypothetical protein
MTSLIHLLLIALLAVAVASEQDVQRPKGFGRRRGFIPRESRHPSTGLGGLDHSGSAVKEVVARDSKPGVAPGKSLDTVSLLRWF